MGRTRGPHGAPGAQWSRQEHDARPRGQRPDARVGRDSHGGPVQLEPPRPAAVPLFAAVAGWACSRGDARLEWTGVRPVVLADLAFVLVACGLVAIVAAALRALGMADAGFVAARAVLVYLGLMLLAAPSWGWRLAPVLPAVFLLAVAVFGRGEDIAHAARWAFIAADEGDPVSWAVTAIVGTVGVLGYLLGRRGVELAPPE